MAATRLLKMSILSVIFMLGVASFILVYITNISTNNFIYEDMNDTTDDYNDLSITKIQSIINAYVYKLSQQNYDNVVPHIDIGNIIFPHLSISNMISSLSSHTIFIGGDSTAENTGLFFLWTLHLFIEENNTNVTLFNFENNKHSLITPKMMNLFHLHKILRFPVQMNHWNNSFYHSRKYKNITKKVNTLVYKHYQKYSINIYGQKVQYCAYYPPLYYLKLYSFDIVITNMDLFFCLHLYSPHLLQLEKYRNDTIEQRHAFTGANLKYRFDENIKIEARLEEFIENAQKHKVKCVIIYGPNAICDKLFYGVWAEARDIWINGNKSILNECLDIIGYGAHELIIDHRNSSGFTMNGFQFCKYNTLTHHGSKWMIERIHKWIRYKQKEIDRNNNNMSELKVLYFNQWQLTNDRCDYTSDGRHFYPLLAVRAEVITNIVQHWC
eukprot:178609_1